MGKMMSVAQICTAQDIGEGAAWTSEPIMIERASAFSLMVTALTGTTIDGITVTYSLGTDKDGTFIVPAGATAIFTTLKVAGIASFTPVMAPFIKFIVTNTDVTDHVVPTIKFIWQEEI
jgi:hypothetical protein